MPPNECPTNMYGPRMPDLRSSFRMSLANPGSVRGIFTGVLRVVSAGGSVYRIVPGLSNLHTRVKRATLEKTAGDDTTGGSVCVSVQGSDESWIPDSRTTAGLPLPLHCRYSLRPFPIAICPAKFPRTGMAFPWPAVVASAGVPATQAATAAATAMTMPLAIRRPRTIAIESLLPLRPLIPVLPRVRGALLPPPKRRHSSNRRDDGKAGESARATWRSGPAELARGNRPTRLRVWADEASSTKDRARATEALLLACEMRASAPAPRWVPPWTSKGGARAVCAVAVAPRPERDGEPAPHRPRPGFTPSLMLMLADAPRGAAREPPLVLSLQSLLKGRISGLSPA